LRLELLLLHVADGAGIDLRNEATHAAPAIHEVLLLGRHTVDVAAGGRRRLDEGRRVVARASGGVERREVVLVWVQEDGAAMVRATGGGRGRDVEVLERIDAAAAQALELRHAEAALRFFLGLPAAGPLLPPR
jgi:hypothetical protein